MVEQSGSEPIWNWRPCRAHQRRRHLTPALDDAGGMENSKAALHAALQDLAELAGASMSGEFIRQGYGRFE